MRTALIAALLLTSTAALAEEQVVASPDARLDRPRFRLGTGLWAGIGGYPFRSVGAVGPSLQLGVQLDDHWAVLAQGQAATLVWCDVYQAQLLAEYTLGDHLSFGTGVMVGGATTRLIWTDTSMVVGIPARLAFVFGPDPVGIFRNRFYVALDGWLGVRVGGTNGLGYDHHQTPFPLGGGLSFGYQLM